MTRPYCERCGLEGEQLARVTVQRPDGHRATITACLPCRQVLRTT
jgi:hypothetical protein